MQNPSSATEQRKTQKQQQKSQAKTYKITQIKTKQQKKRLKLNWDYWVYVWCEAPHLQITYYVEKARALQKGAEDIPPSST